MNFIEFLSQLFIITFSIFAGLLLAFYLVWPKIESYILRLNSLNSNRSFLKEQQQLHFSAYERLLLLVDRMEPMQVMLRHKGQAQHIEQFRQLLIADIESEFQHNFTQQLYVTDAAWTAVKDLKENTIGLFRNAYKGLPENATLNDYIAIVLHHVNELDVNPYQAAQLLLKKELSV